MPEPIWSEEQIAQLRRDWFNNVVTTWSEARERTEAGQSTAVEWDGEIADPVPEDTPRRRPRPRGSYNRGLCIVRRRRAQAACHRRCPCRATYDEPTPVQQPVEPPVIIEFDDGSSLNFTIRNIEARTWTDDQGNEFTDEFVRSLLDGEREGGHQASEYPQEASDAEFNRVMDAIDHAYSVRPASELVIEPPIVRCGEPNCPICPPLDTEPDRG